MSSNSYVLAVDAPAQQRLQLQHELYADSSQQFLLKTGLTSTMDVLEVGCGEGSMTTWLATQAKHVTAIDINLPQVEATRAKLAQQCLTNVDCLQKDIFDIEEMQQQFDLVYCRMVLHHVTEPEIAVAILKKVLRKGGILVLEEPPVVDSIICYPANAAVTKFFEIIAKCYYPKAIHFAYRMASVLTRQGYSVFQQNMVQPLLVSTAQRYLFRMSLNDLKPKFIAEKLINEAEAEILYQELSTVAETAECLSWVRMFQVAAKIK